MENNNYSSELLSTNTDDAINLLREKSNPIYEEEIYNSSREKVGNVYLWKILKGQFLYSVCLSNIENEDTWWSGKHIIENLPEPRTNPDEPDKPDEQTDYLVSFSRVRHDNFSQLEGWLRAELSSPFYGQQYVLDRQQPLHMDYASRLQTAENISVFTGIDPETIMNMRFDYMGEPVYKNRQSVYFHGLENPTSGLSLAVKYTPQSHKWHFVRLEEAHRRTYELYSQNRNHWIESIDSAWEKVTPDHLSEIVRGMHLAASLLLPRTS